jgi:hypothetical protein
MLLATIIFCHLVVKKNNLSIKDEYTASSSVSARHFSNDNDRKENLDTYTVIQVSRR